MANQRLTIGEVRFSYLHVFEPFSFDDSIDAKYSAVILIPKTNTTVVAQVKKAIEDAYKDAVTMRWGGKKPPMDKVTPLRDGDEPNADGESRGEAYEGNYYINAKSRTQPGVVDKKRQPIMSTEEFYSGCYGYVNIAFGAYDNGGNKGISVYLNNLLKTRDGEPLGVSRSSAEEDFAGLSFDEDDDEI